MKFAAGNWRHLWLYLNAYAPVLVWAFLIFYLSSQSTLPGAQVSSVDFLLKKAGHITVYAVLCWLLNRGFMITHPKASKTTRWLSLLLVFIYACTDEYHQMLTPNRNPSSRDIGFDMFGATLAWLVFYHRQRVMHKT